MSQVMPTLRDGAARTPARAPGAQPGPTDTSTSLALDTLAPGRFRARTDPRYWNQIGPFGGWIAALAAEALLQVAPAGWPLRAVNLQFLGRLPAGTIDVEVEPLRLQRRVAGLRATLRPTGDARVAVTAEAVFGLAGATTPAAARPRPELSPAQTLPRLATLDTMAAFVRSFDHRVAFGAPFGGGSEPRSGGWIRSRLPLPAGPAALLMLADAWFPPRWAAQTEPVPVSTVSMQVAFHDADSGAAPPDGFFAAQFEDDGHAGGFGLERGMLWWPDGRLALTMQQLTWIGAAGGRGERP